MEPRLRLPYFTYVMRGLDDAGVAWRFKKTDAPSQSGMAIVAGGRRIWVDTNDMAAFDEDAYAWCDTFAKVNCTHDDLARHPKTVLIGPVFGIRRWSLPWGYGAAARIIAAGGHPRATLQGIRFQGKTREPFESYQPGRAEPAFVYHRSRAWAGKHGGTNAPRERFIAALDGLGLTTSTALTDERVSLGEYLELTRRSSVVFNCPAVHGCLGWKLGEYLALGKAIISTPLGRELPAPLVHGEHLHFVEDDIDAMREAVALVIGDDAYRRHLEVGARAWFERELSPTRVAHRVLGTDVGTS